eukprot:gene24164-1536_t
MRSSSLRLAASQKTPQAAGMWKRSRGGEQCPSAETNTEVTGGPHQEKPSTSHDLCDADQRQVPKENEGQSRGTEQNGTGEDHSSQTSSPVQDPFAAPDQENPFGAEEVTQPSPQNQQPSQSSSPVQDPFGAPDQEDPFGANHAEEPQTSSPISQEPFAPQKDGDPVGGMEALKQKAKRPKVQCLICAGPLRILPSALNERCVLDHCKARGRLSCEICMRTFCLSHDGIKPLSQVSSPKQQAPQSSSPACQDPFGGSQPEVTQPAPPMVSTLEQQPSQTSQDPFAASDQEEPFRGMHPRCG